MKLLHLSDLHLGKRVNNFSMLEDQAYILERILEIIDGERPNVVLIAGDVYDKTIPSAEAVALLDSFLVKLADRSLPVLLISGNHDSPERLAFANRLMKGRGVYIAPVYHGEVVSVTLEDDHGPVDFWLLPFLKPIHFRRFFPEEGVESYTDAMACAIRHMPLDPARRNVLVTHQFVTGADVDCIVQSGCGLFDRWDKLNQAKEDYRSRTAFGLDGGRTALNRAGLAAILERMERAVRDGIRRAVELGGGICPAYFTFEAAKVAETPDGPMPASLSACPLPLFLEGPTRWLKLDASRQEKQDMAEKVRQSGLYDQFARDLRTAAVPFLDPVRYGCSPLESVSFLASSANPDPAVWGRGFVAQLSGSTAEFLQIWQLMFFGPNLFRMGEAGSVSSLQTLVQSISENHSRRFPRMEGTRGCRL